MLSDGIAIATVTQAGTAASALENLEVWISRKGYLEEVRIRLEDRDDKWVELVFQPFIDDVVIADE